jgi:hypothetical protein
MLDGYWRRLAEPQSSALEADWTSMAWAAAQADGYLFEQLLRHLAGAGRAAERDALLLRFRWMRAKLEACGLQALRADYGLRKAGQDVGGGSGGSGGGGGGGGQRHGEHRPLEGEGAGGASSDDAVETALRVGRALELAAHTLAPDPMQLASQLVGRLGHREEPSLRSLVCDVRSTINADTAAGIGHPLLLPAVSSLEHVRDPSTDPLLRVLCGHDGEVASVAVSADASTAVSGGEDGTVRVWSLVEGQERERVSLPGSFGPQCSVAVSADGLTAVTSGDDGALRVWSLVEGDERERASLLGRAGLTGLTVHDGRRYSSAQTVAISAGGSTAVSGYENGTLRVWRARSGSRRF